MVLAMELFQEMQHDVQSHTYHWHVATQCHYVLHHHAQALVRNAAGDPRVQNAFVCQPLPSTPLRTLTIFPGRHFTISPRTVRTSTESPTQNTRGRSRRLFARHTSLFDLAITLALRLGFKMDNLVRNLRFKNNSAGVFP
ncbi:unnamed protein product, partial [Ixodes pacificus]